MSVLGVRSQ